MDEVGRKLVNSLFATTCSRVQVEVVSVVNFSFFHGEDIRAEFELAAVWAQEIFKRQLGLTFGKSSLQV
jgi:hypothetical protein